MNVKFWNKKPLRQAASEGSPSAEGNAAPAPDAGPDLSFIPEAYVKDGKPDLDGFKAHYAEVVDKAGKVKEAPDAYEFALPADMKFEGLDLPEGFKVDLDPANEAYAPLFGEFGEFLKGIGAPKEAASQALGILAKYEAMKEAASYAAFKADVTALGGEAKFTERFNTIKRAAESRLPADQVEALLSGGRISEKGFKAVEALLSGQSLSAPSANPPEKTSDPLAARYPKSAA
jgi:hypothetical protein